MTVSINRKSIENFVMGVGQILFILTALVVILCAMSAILFGGVLGILIIVLEFTNGTGGELFMSYPEPVRVGIVICTAFAIAFAMMPQDPHY